MKLFDSINSIISLPFDEIRVSHLHDALLLHDQVGSQIAEYKSLVDHLDQQIDEIEANTALDCKADKQSDIVTRATQKLARLDLTTQKRTKKRILDSLIAKQKTLDWRVPIARDEVRRQSQIV